MSRLLFMLMLVAVALAVCLVLAAALRAVFATGRDRMQQAEFGGRSMQKLSFVLLCALILYVSIWGGA